MGIKGTRGIVSRLCQDAGKKAKGWRDATAKEVVSGLLHS